MSETSPGNFPRCCAAGWRPLARHLSGRTRAACARRHLGRDRGRALHLRTRPGRGAQARRDLACRDGQARAGERERPDPADPRRHRRSGWRGASGTGARFIQPFVAVAGRRMLLDDATGGGFVLLASPRRDLVGASRVRNARPSGASAGRSSSSAMTSATRTAISPPGLPRTARSRCCCGRISTSTASRAMPRIWPRLVTALRQCSGNSVNARRTGLIKVASAAIMRAPESRRRAA